MSGISGLGGMLAGLEARHVTSLDVERRIDRYGNQPGNWAARHGVERALSGLLRRSVDAGSGNKVCLAADEVDIKLPGRLPIMWARYHSSALKNAGLLGPGWRTAWEATLRREEDRLAYTDDQGRVLSLPMPHRGSQVIVSSEQLHVAHLPDGRMVVADLTPHYSVFGEFDEAGVARLKYIEDLHKQRIGCIWDDAGRLKRMRGTCGHELKMHYGSDGHRLTGIECVDGGPTGWLVHYGYDDDGRLAEVRNRIGDVVRRFVYENGRIVREVGPLGQTTQYKWEVRRGAARVIERSTCRGARDRFNYDPDEGRCEVIDTFGHAAQWKFDRQGNISSHTDFAGGRYTFVYDSAGWPTQLNLPGDRQVRITFDNLGRVTRETDPLGGERSTIYAFATREPVTVRESDGRLWVWRHDDRLRAIHHQSPSHGSTQIAYSEHERGETHSYVTDRGTSITIEWDRRGQVIGLGTAPDKATTYRRDAEGRVVEIVDPVGAVTKIENDLLGRPLIVTLPGGRQERRVWNAAGQLVKITGPDGYSRLWHRDSYGRVVQFVDEEGSVTAHEYDAHGRRIRTASGNGATQEFEWGPADRLVSIVDADRVTRTLSYSMAGWLQQIATTAESMTRREIFVHDAVGRLIGRETEHAHYHYAYTQQGLLGTIDCSPTEAGEAIGVAADTIRFEYNPFGLVTAEHGGAGVLHYEYDERGRTRAVTLPDGCVVKSERDEDGRVALVGMTCREESRGIAAFRYDNLGRQVLRSQGELYLRSVYTSASELERCFAMSVVRTPNNEMQAGEVRYWREFQYSIAGNITQVGDRFEGKTYCDYDRRGRLLRMLSDEVGIEYFTWDAAGNLFDTAHVAASVVACPDHRMREYKGYQYEYDAWGNVICKRSAAAGQSFTWDAEGRLMEVRSRQARVRFRYDALGRRTSKSIERHDADHARQANSSTEVVHFVWEGERLMQERSEKEIRTFLYQPAADGFMSYAPLARVDQVRDADGNVQPMRLYHYHVDAAGTAVAMTDDAGALAWAGRYSAWGRILPPTSLKVQIDQPLRFAGHYADDEVRLHLNGTRYYDPDTGRYLSPDRSAEPGTSPYRYVSNPQTACNPTGRAVTLARPRAGKRLGSSVKRTFDLGEPAAGLVAKLDDVVDGALIQLGQEV